MEYDRRSLRSLRVFPAISQVLKDGSVTIRFGPFDLAPDSRQLTRDDRELHLTPKAFDLLALLLEARAATPAS